MSDRNELSRVVRFATRGRRQATLIGRDPSGRKIWGGPYTIWQGLAAIAVPFVLWNTRGLWSGVAGHPSGLGLIVTIAAVSGVIAWLVGRLVFSHNPLWSLAGLLANYGQVLRGGPAGKTSRTDRSARRPGSRCAGAAYVVETPRQPEPQPGRRPEPQPDHNPGLVHPQPGPTSSAPEPALAAAASASIPATWQAGSVQPVPPPPPSRSTPPPSRSTPPPSRSTPPPLRPTQGPMSGLDAFLAASADSAPAETKAA